MNVLLLGNGFDLYHYLPTKYINFIHTIQFLADSDDVTRFKTAGQVLGNAKLQTIDDFIANCYEKNKEAFDASPLDSNIIEDMIRLAKENSWFRLFRKRCSDDIGWIDFEKEIAHVVDTFDEKTKEYKRKELYQGELMPDEVDAFSCFPEIVSRSPRMDIDYVFTHECTYAAVPGTVERYISRERIAEKLCQALVGFNLIFTEYLNEFIEKPIELASNSIIKSDLKFDAANLVLTYNYTRTYEFLYRSNASVHHVHGELRKGIVIGINSDGRDELGAVDTTFIAFKKYFQRVKLGIDEGFIKAIETVKSVNRSYLTVVGHSLDVTDKDTLKELFAASSSILIYYHNDNALGTYIANIIKMFGKREFDKLRSNAILRFEKLPDICTAEKKL